MDIVHRYVAAELATDIVINVGEVKFYLHKVRAEDSYDLLAHLTGWYVY